MAAGIPKTPLERITGTILFSTTDPNPRSNGSVWLLPDGGPAFRMEKEVLREGVYKTINERNRKLQGYAAVHYPSFVTDGCSRPINNLRIAADLWSALWRRLALGVVPVVAGSIIYSKL